MVSLKFYTFLPTCGELLDPFFIKKLEDVSRPNCARTPLLRRRFEIDVRPMPPSGAQTNDNRWGTNLGCRVDVPRFPSGIPSVYQLCEARHCCGAESHFWLADRAFCSSMWLSRRPKAGSSTQHSQYDVREGSRRAIRLSSPKKWLWELFQLTRILAFTGQCSPLLRHPILAVFDSGV